MKHGASQMCGRHQTPFFTTSLIIASLMMMVTIPSAFAQTPATPAAPPHVVRVQTGYSCGMCGGLFYHTTTTTIEPSFLVWEGTNSSNPKTLPNKKTRVAITREDWKNLLRSIDVSALRALPQQGCRSCRDLPESWLVIEYSDGSRIAVNYGPSEIPKPVAAIKFPAVLIPMWL
jgi:hypothetical protein